MIDEAMSVADFWKGLEQRRSAAAKKHVQKMTKYTTLSAFLIEQLRHHARPMSVSELLGLVQPALSTLRKSDGRKYSCANARLTVESALFSIPVFRETEEGWVLDEKEAKGYEFILRNINRKLGKATTVGYDVDQAYALLLHRLTVEGKAKPLSLVKRCAKQIKASESRHLTAFIMGLFTGEAVVATFGRERSAGICVMYHFMRHSKAITSAVLLPQEELFRRKVSNLSLSALYLEHKLGSEVDCLRCTGVAGFRSSRR